MEERQVIDWISGYERAWSTNEPDDIGSLFTDDAEYRTAPDAEPRRGRASIVAGWLEDRDEPGDATFSYEVIGVAGSTAFVQGVTTYRADEERPLRTYDNLWVIDLDDEGRARSFTEWYMRRR